jgi:hypothetical protein
MPNLQQGWRTVSIALLSVGLALMMFGVWQGNRYDDLQKQINNSDEWRSIRYIYEQQAILARSNYWVSGNMQENLRTREKELEDILERKFPRHAQMSSGFLSKFLGTLLIFVGIIGVISIPKQIQRRS